MSLSDELSRLDGLRASGALSDEEFERAKARVLGSSNWSEGVASDLPGVAAVNGLRRSRSDRLVGGVCGGIARATGIESWIWRLLFVVLFIFAGAGFLAYVLLWIFVPSD